MSALEYTVEFDGINYMVLKSGQVLAAFADVESAYDAKRSFVNKNLPKNWQKVPPSIQMAKELLYGKPSAA
ncbi:MAG: hypothetical protein U9R28_09085 [Pseudomonadota bacterium]|nr:hypothetical protein [Pseudomonadota bacterium]